MQVIWRLVGKVFSLYYGMGFVVLSIWAIYRLTVGRQYKWLSVLNPLYALLSWGCYRVIRVRRGSSVDRN
jgi:hypothetical protein